MLHVAAKHGPRVPVGCDDALGLISEKIPQLGEGVGEADGEGGRR
jgi:hypothetical protein